MLFCLWISAVLQDFQLNIYFKVVKAKQKERTCRERPAENTPLPKQGCKQSASSATSQFDLPSYFLSWRNFDRFMCDTRFSCNMESL